MIAFLVPRAPRRGLPAAGLLVVMALIVQGCVYYAPPPGPSTYDRAWDSAARAAQDAGIQLSSADRATGQMLGTRGAIGARISVTRQADGTTRVELNLSGPLQSDPGLSDRFNAAYERYMGR